MSDEINYMVCWEGSLQCDVSKNSTNLNYVEDTNSFYTLIRAKDKLEAVEKFLSYEYNLFLEHEHELNDNIFERFCKVAIYDIYEEYFDGCKNQKKLVDLMSEINKKYEYMIPEDEGFADKIIQLFKPEQLFSLLSEDEVKRLWIQQNIYDVAVIELEEIE